MSKAQKIKYWISTVWISFSMLSGIIFQLLPMPKAEVRFEL
jgi:hypothetical protein